MYTYNGEAIDNKSNGIGFLFNDDKNFTAFFKEGMMSQFMIFTALTDKNDEKSYMGFISDQ